MDLPNPFTPVFGKVPPFLAGRDDILNSMERAFARGGSDPNLTSLFIGARGTGKTALLASVAQLARANGWIVANVSALPGMLDDIIERTVESASGLIDDSERIMLKGLSLGPTIGFEIDRTNSLQGNWRTRMSTLLSQLEQYGTGLLICVDEVQLGLDEMVQLASVYQHFVQEDRKVALVMAGLPVNIAHLESDRAVSFLRRARHHHLGRVADIDVERAFARTVAEAGAEIDADSLKCAVRSIGGFPFMMQLVGFWTWDQCRAERIGLADVERGADMARRDFRDGVLASTFRELSKGDVRFLHAMMQDQCESRLSEVAARMGVASNYASRYKERLLRAGVIEEMGGGYYDMALPGFREYLIERLGGVDGTNSR